MNNFYMKNNFTFLILCFLCVGFIQIQAQGLDDLLDELEPEPQTELVRYAFKSPRIINLQSLEKVAPGTLEFRIAHRFNRLDEGLYDIFGLDGAEIRFSLDYGINEWLSVGLGRSSLDKAYDASVKASILRQTKGKKVMPVSVLFFGSVTAKTRRGLFPISDEQMKTAYRFAYTGQLIIGSKINDWLSLQLSPSVVYRNLVVTNEDSNLIPVIGFGGRLKISKRVALTGEYNLRIGSADAFEFGGTDNFDGYVNSASIGVDIETGGHVFALHFTNSKGMYEQNFLTETTDSWLDGGIHFGFNLTRQFTVNKKQIKKW